MSDKIYIFDEITVSVDASAELRAAYLGEYAPAARRRGMTLEGAWRSPPLEVPGRQVTLHFLWSVPDVARWWGMRVSGGQVDPESGQPADGDEEKTRWWAWVDAIATHRKRTFMTDMADATDV